MPWPKRPRLLECHERHVFKWQKYRFKGVLVFFLTKASLILSACNHKILDEIKKSNVINPLKSWVFQDFL